MVEETENTSSSDVNNENTGAEFRVEKTDLEPGEGDNSEKSGRGVQARIDELTGKIKTQEEELVRVKSELAAKQTQPPTNTAPNPAATPEAQKALAYLESIGVPTERKLQEQIKAVEDRLLLDNEHSRLVNAFDGSDGRPRYDKTRTEQYMRDNGVFNPEAAYKLMHESELLDWQMKKANGGKTNRPFVERAGGGGVNRSSQSEITREKLQDVAANPTPSNRAWYERNRTKILDMLANGQV